ncbi:hypothetical protein [Streptomyces aureus]|uniref:Uncharacterized protein n=1 Tax=Streptomyces aureus TaxID=193461 RepID=A0ABV4SYM1_9ACTN
MDVVACVPVHQVQLGERALHDPPLGARAGAVPDGATGSRRRSVAEHHIGRRRARRACPTPAAPPEAAHKSQTVIDNPATRQGGGINSGQHSEITLTDSKIADNLPDNTAEDTPARGQNT